MTFVRHWMPLLICVAGVLVLVIRGFDETGWEAVTLLVAAGSSVWLLNVLFRLGVRGDVERDAEAAARRFFDEHGHWPDEPPPPGAPRPGAEDVSRPPSPPHGAAERDAEGGDPRRVRPHGHRRRP